MEFYVKNGASAVEFFNQNALEKPNDHFGDGPNVYSLMKDEILIKATGEINVGDTVKFELLGREQYTRKTLTNKYLYDVKEHDSICNKLVLKEFEIVVVNPPKGTTINSSGQVSFVNCTI